MTNEQWERLLSIVQGKGGEERTAGFIIDSPWLPNWAGTTILDYYASENAWFEANMKAMKTFPDFIFLPGFWSEYGMCSEPASFGAKCVFHENEFPFAHKILDMMGDFGSIEKPNPECDGLAPFVLRRLKMMEPRINEAGHQHRFAVARGPLNIAGFLMGNTELLMAMKMSPDQTHALFDTVTSFLEDWLQLQKKTLPSIDGIMLLDDVVGFLGPEDYEEFVRPYLTRAFAAFDSSVRLFHNDAPGMVCAPQLHSCGINMFNWSHEHPIAEIHELAGPEVALLGNIPPRDTLAQGTPEQVAESVAKLRADVPDTARVLYSCGGGMPPNVSTDNLIAFREALK